MANFPGFIGGTYQGRAMAADAERSINFYPERLESREGATKSEWVLLSKPGLSLFAALPTSPVQGMYQITPQAQGQRAFAVAGGVLYELFPNGSFSSRGSVLATMGLAQFSANQTQLLIVVGGNGFIFTFATNTLTRITASGWIPGATSPVFIDGYFICLEPASQLFFISALNDGTSWNPLDFGDAEGAPGNFVGMIADHRQLWLLASDHSEVYYNSGAANFPFSRLEGAFMQAGCAVGATVAKVDNTIMWLGADEKGDRMVWRAQGYTPQRISNHSVEAFLQSYPSTPGTGGNGDESAYSYQEGGHTFYRLDFPSAPSISGASGQGATWLYDVATGMWHERGYWNAPQGLYQADLARTHCFSFRKHLVGDYQTGNVYEQSMAFFLDNGALIRRVRSAPDLSSGGRFSFYSELRLLAQVGVGPGGSPAFVAPPSVVPSIVHNNSGNQNSVGAASTISQTFASANTAGNAIIVIAASAANVTINLPTDTQLNKYKLLFALPPIPGSAGVCSIFVAYGIKAGGNTVTVTFSGVGSSVNMMFREYVNLPQAYTVLSAAAHVTGSPWQVALGTALVTANNMSLAVSYSTNDPSDMLPIGSWTWLNLLSTSIFGHGIRSFDANLTAGPFTGLFSTLSAENFCTTAMVLFGVGLVPGPGTLPAYYDPQIILQCSNDGGFTWGIERQASLGKAGNYGKLVRWRRLGRSNNRAFRVICSEPVFVALIAADLDTR
jgi:hypothetical protein